MINESDIVFVTTSMFTKWMDYQQNLLKSNFPDSQFIVVDGRSNWPKVWFSWIEEVKKTDAKWYIHVDEDCFIESKQEVLNLLQKMEDENIGISAISEAFCHFRGANPVAFNSFFMAGRTSDIKDLNINFQSVNFWVEEGNWKNSLGYSYKEEYLEDFLYPHEKACEHFNFSQAMEPYYLFCWLMKEKKIKVYYLFPHFDERFRSTNPRITKDSPDIAIHMWYTRMWGSPMDVHGLPNHERYDRLEKYLLSNKF